MGDFRDQEEQLHRFLGKDPIKQEMPSEAAMAEHVRQTFNAGEKRLSAWFSERESRIAALEAENKSLEQERDEYMVTANKEAFANSEAERRIAVLEADRERLVEALSELRKTAVLLQQNAEGCAANHYAHDFKTHGLPGWLADTAAVIKKTSTALAAVKGEQ